MLEIIYDQLKKAISRGMKITLLAACLAASTGNAARAEPITGTIIVVGIGKLIAWWGAKTVIVAKAAPVVKAVTAVKVAAPAALKGGVTGGAKGAINGATTSAVFNAGKSQSLQIIKRQSMGGAATGALREGGRVAYQTYKQLD